MYDLALTLRSNSRGGKNNSARGSEQSFEYQLNSQSSDHGSQWKILILDEGSKRLVDCVTKEDDILQENVTSV